MAKKTRSIGMREILLADVSATGGMPEANLKSIARTLKGTANFTTEQDQTQDFYCEEEPDAPVESVSSEKGLKSLTFNILEWDNAALVRVFGGSTKSASVTIGGVSKTVEKFVPPKEYVEVEQAVRVLTPYKVGIDIPRAKIMARFVWNLTRTEIAQIECQARALSPVGDEDGAYEIFSYE